ncbi:NAD(P)/FAD-dependent oxidoreductase, partial [Candidatus Auribacterota bacterium]
AVIEGLYNNGIKNGVELEIIDSAKLRSVEPNVEGVCALYSPSTGIVDSHRLMKYFADSAKGKGAEIVFGSEVKEIEKTADAYKIMVSGAGEETFSFESAVVVNCAGLESDIVAAMTGVDIDRSGYRLHYSKGSYFRVSSGKASMISRLVYPVPDSGQGVLGIHATLDLGGGLRLGPDSEYIEREKADYAVREDKKGAFYDSVRVFLPFLELEDLCPDTAGIRPKLHGPEESFRDFIVRHEEDKGYPGLIDLIGIESPGLTASPYIGKYVSGLIDGIIG